MIPESFNNLHELVDASILAHSSRIAISDADETLTYHDLDEAAQLVAQYLKVEGIQQDEPVIVITSNRARDLAAFIGVWRAGGVVAPLHINAVARTTANVFFLTDCRFVVSEYGGLPPGIDEIAKVDKLNAPVIRLRRPSPAKEESLRGAALIVFTSGTTGLPKGVILGHRGYINKLHAVKSLLPFDASMHTLLALQLTFSFGQWTSLMTLANGGTLHLHSKFDPDIILASLQAHQIHWYPAVPSMMRALLPLLNGEPGLAAIRKLAQLQSPEVIMAGGEPLPETLGRQIRRLIPHAGVADVYGLTETNSADFILAPSTYDQHAGSIGTTCPGVKFRIMDSGREMTDAGTIGELQIDTPYVMRGYLKQPEMTAESFDGGYLKTGDLAYVDRQGLVRLVGRSKDQINRGGNKVSPIEVESVFLDHPDISAAAATGLYDEALGERIHLVLVPKVGRTLEKQQLLRFASNRLERYKYPDFLYIGRSIPYGTTGKIDRSALRSALLAGSPEYIQLL